MDCLILAGNRENYRKVSDENNKAFLQIENRTILNIMLEELRLVDEIDRIFVVGPKDRLEQHLASVYGGSYPKTLEIFEQKNNMVENILSVVEASETGDDDRYLMVIPSDMPLMIAEEVRLFIKRCNMNDYDMISGINSDRVLARFEPENGKPGVHITSFKFSDGGFRINNLHMVRPSRIGGIEYIKKAYALRYQKNLVNFFKIIGNLFMIYLKVPGSVLFYLGIQLSLQLRSLRWNRLARVVEKRMNRKKIMKYVSRILDTRYCYIDTEYGGSALDIDNDDDYNAVCSRHSDWVAIQKKMTPLEEGRN